MKLLGIYLEVLLVNINKLAWLSECFSMFYTSFSHSHTKGQNYECSFKGNIPHTLTHIQEHTLVCINKLTHLFISPDGQTYSVYANIQLYAGIWSITKT